MTRMSAYPSIENRSKGDWSRLCGFRVVPGDGCVWVYKSFGGNAYLGMDASGREGYFGQDNFGSIDALWSWIDGYQSWLRLTAALPPREPIAKSVTDSKRGTEIARAMSSEEQGLRTAFGSGGVVHTVGGIAAAIFGAGPLVPIIGQAQDQLLDARYGKR